MKQTLALCMIVRDEEKYLADCLESVVDVVDQIVVVDTGSRDKTVKIAQSYNAEIYNFTWCDDFSKARNESIKYAKTDWILWMDADERLQPESSKEIKKILKPENKPIIYRVQINSKTYDGGIRLSSAHRLFINKKGIHFTGKIHEQVSVSAAKLGGEERESSIIIDHLGYDLPKDEQIKKNLRNQALLEKMVKENPKDAYAQYTLAQQCALNEDWNKAIECYEKAYQLDQFEKRMKVSLLNTMAEAYFNTEDFKKTLSFSEQSIRLEPLQVGGYYLLYRLSDKYGETKKSIYWLEKLLENNQILSEQVKTISTDVLIDEKRIYYVLGSLYKKVQKFEFALKYFKKFQQIEPDRIEVLERLVEIYLQLGKLSEAANYLQILLKKKADNQNYIDLFGVILIKQQKFHEAITYYEKTFENNPQNQLALKRLVGLYGKVGEFNKANRLMEAIA